MCCILPAVDITRSPGWMGMGRTRIGAMGVVFGSICLGLIDEVGVFGLIAVRAFLLFLGFGLTSIWVRVVCFGSRWRDARYCATGVMVVVACLDLDIVDLLDAGIILLLLWDAGMILLWDDKIMYVLNFDDIELRQYVCYDILSITLTNELWIVWLWHLHNKHLTRMGLDYKMVLI